ncbi:ATP-binding protein [Catenovulum sp. 2E275]|uniref:CHASE domain-containing protein n=1 Tax=Catenovulum sp. 2E275 TaxID=2980497 RepID=UPI0021CE87AC|nr:CHASE domain-containing protein [Catenovulum sp. 2E275]MCU4675822.1 ATP-binding protein [Catenovulum sp. 2E275]
MPSIITKNIIAFFLYFIAAMFGALFALPSEISSPIWPAAGVAAGLCIIWTYRVLPALLTASLIYYFLSFDEPSLNATIATIGLSIATCIQAFCASVLVSKLLKKSFVQLKPYELITFFCKVAPISCLISSTISILILTKLAYLNLSNILYNWLTWWLGDTLSCLIISPIIILINYRKELNLQNKLPMQLIPTFLVFSIVATAFVFSRSQFVNNQKEALSATTQEITHLIKTQVELYQVNLQALGAFIQSNKELSEQEFLNFSQKILNNKTIVQAVEWIEPVNAQEKSDFYSHLSELHHTEIHYKFFDDNSPDVTYAIVFAYPKTKNSQIIGLDLATEPKRSTAIRKALTTDGFSFSEPVTLLQSQNGNKGALLFHAVYEDTPPEKLRGLITLVIEYKDLFSQTNFYMKEKGISNYAISIDFLNHIQLYQYDNLDKTLPVYTSHIQLDILNQTWQLKLTLPQENLIQQQDWASWVILVIGSIITLSIQLFIIWLSINRNLITQKVSLKTKELNEAKEKAEQATLQKTYFLANMSHELRTPLNAIMGLTDMFNSSELNNTQQDYIRKIRTASKTLLSLISDILDLSKIETGKIELEVAPFSLNRLVNRMSELFTSQIENKGLAFKINYKPLVNDKILGDEHRLQQVIMNLCSNALKFTEFGGITLTIQHETSQSDNSKLILYIEVSDTGTGIPQDRIQSIFESFTQADSSITRKFGGSGLGLSISNNLIKLMGGSLCCESQFGIGSRFYFELSMKKSASGYNTSKQPEKIIDYALRAKKLLQGQPVLIAEDNEINQQIIIFQMEQLGADVTLAENGYEAVEYCKTRNFKLVLMDIQMPVLDGIEATKQILALPNANSSKIIAMTANVSIEDKAACLKAGMLAHIPKPFDVNKLHQTLINVLES